MRRGAIFPPPSTGARTQMVGFSVLETLWKRNIMSKYSLRSRIASAARTNRRKKPLCVPARRLGFESLEHRQLLSSVGLASISNITLPAGTSYLVALNGSDPRARPSTSA